MPAYEYYCDSCGDRTTIMRSYSDEEETPTCTCGKEMLRIWNAPGIHFKGGGWGGQG